MKYLQTSNISRVDDDNDIDEDVLIYTPKTTIIAYAKEIVRLLLDIAIKRHPK